MLTGWTLTTREGEQDEQGNSRRERDWDGGRGPQLWDWLGLATADDREQGHRPSQVLAGWLPALELLQPDCKSATAFAGSCDWFLVSRPAIPRPERCWKEGRDRLSCVADAPI
jgi:hypothetical protein